MTTRARTAGWVSVQGHYAGSVSRLLAFLLDAVVSAGLFALGLAATSLAVQVVTGHPVNWNRTNLVVVIIFGAWEFFYFGYSWAASGRTFGMAVLGIRVVRADGTDLDPWHGVLRALVFPLSFLFFGLGFLGILVQREHRALHDLLASTAVIYTWDARAARLRFLAREAEAGAPGSSPRPAGSEGRDSDGGTGDGGTGDGGTGDGGTEPVPPSSDVLAGSHEQRPADEDIQHNDAD